MTRFNECFFCAQALKAFIFVETKKYMSTILIVGASSGLGLEVAKIYIAQGHNVCLAARRQEPLAELVALAPERVSAAFLDVTASDAEQRMDELLRSSNPDVLFYSSGVGSQNRQLKADIEARTFATNAMGFGLMLGCAFRFFAERGKGHIAAITSIAGTKGLGPSPAYSATKAFGSTYLEALAQLAHIRGVELHVTELRAGFVSTPLLGDKPTYPMLLDAADVARKMVRAVERRKAVVIIDWRWSIVTALWRLIPRFIWRRLKL